MLHDAPTARLADDAAVALEAARAEIASLRGELARSKKREVELATEVARNDVYRSIVQNLPTGAVFAFDHELRFVVAEGTDLALSMGLEKHEIVGRTVRDVIAPVHLDAIEPIYQDTLAGRARHIQVRRAGRVFDVRTVPIRDESGNVVGGLAKSFDVTERHDEAERLRTVTAQLAILLDHLSTGVVFSDRNGRVQIVNRAMGMLLGMSNPAELVGTRMSDPIHAERFEETDAVTGTVADRTLARVSVIGDRLHLKSGRILERDYLPVEARMALGGDLWCYRDVTDRERARAQLADQANTLRELSMRDELTGLKNRRGFLLLGEQQVKLAHRTNRPMAVFFIDLNGMKAINDRLGHDEGDRALHDAARVLSTTFRDSDVVARLGGDEFVVLATDCPSAMVPAVKARLEAAIDLFNADAARRYQLSMSIGIASYEPSAENVCGIEELMAQADARMYDEKVRRYRSTVPRVSFVCERPTVPPGAGESAPNDAADSPRRASY